MSPHALGLHPGKHPCCLSRGVAAQSDDLSGPFVSEGSRAGRLGITT